MLMKKTIWLLTDSRMGSVGQMRGIAAVLPKEKFEIMEKKLVYTPLSALPNVLRGHSLLGIDKESRPGISRDFPDIVLSASRRSAPAALWIKKASKGKTKIVQLLYPGQFFQQDFDLIIIPEHDRGKLSGKNILYTVGSPHRITDETLNAAHKKWETAFAGLPRPLTALIIGGNIKGKGFTEENAENLALAVKKFKQNNGGALLITDSSRTGENAEKNIMKILKDIPTYSYLWGDKSENPYLGYLSEADNIIVTGDSVSMCCEACGTGKPVYVFCGKNWLTPKHERFVRSLYNAGYAAPLGEKNNFQPKGKLNPAYEAAKKIEQLV